MRMVVFGLYNKRKKTTLKIIILLIVVLCFYWLIGTPNSEEQAKPPLIIINERVDSIQSPFTEPKVKPNFENQIDINQIVDKNDFVPKKKKKLQIQSILKPIPIKDDIISVTPGLGEEGVPVNLNPEEQKEADKLFKEAAFNVYLSNRISLNRSIPDPRNSVCKEMKYVHDLPTASVIIIFTNEMWSVLLRTIYTVILRTPVHLLKEIILVDDFSDKIFLKEKLDDFLKTNFKEGLVKIIHLTQREGLVRARLAGAKLASGDVMVFLDAHCETATQWLEPLLERIKEKRSAVLCPIIDVIDDKTFEYYAHNGDYFQVGGFTWSGHFTWIEAPDWDDTIIHSKPTDSPTMAGGLFAIDRQYFWEIGSYDEGMDIWGGENLEMSFRIWMCGGSLEIVPCSHVGHVFRDYHPYTFPGNKDTHGINTVRTVEVWMDSYKKYFYQHRKDLEKIQYGDISNRLALRERLKCKNFEWFLKNVYKNKFVVDQNVLAYGEVRNPISKLCLDTFNNKEDVTYDIGLYLCHKFDNRITNQYFSLTYDGHIRREEGCLEAPETISNLDDMVVTIDKCVNNSAKQKWIHKKGGTIIHSATKLCLEVNKIKNSDKPILKICDDGYAQIWWFSRYTDIQLDIKNQNIHL